MYTKVDMLIRYSHLLMFQATDLYSLNTILIKPNTDEDSKFE